MKRIAAIALILLMSLQCFYQLGVITYFQLNRDYIAEVLCINRDKPITMCYGQCFLDNKLDLSDQSADDATLPPGSQKGDLPNFLITEYNYSFQEGAQIQPSNSRYIFSNSSAHSEAPFHPPASLS